MPLVITKLVCCVLIEKWRLYRYVPNALLQYSTLRLYQCRYNSLSVFLSMYQSRVNSLTGILKYVPIQIQFSLSVYLSMYQSRVNSLTGILKYVPICRYNSFFVFLSMYQSRVNSLTGILKYVSIQIQFSLCILEYVSI